jgi:hypothetical protein
MDKKVKGLLGAAAALVISAPASYAELLAPIHNPIEALKADDAAQAAKVELVGWKWNGYKWLWYGNYYNPYYHHHHHHHHHAHHHHHHHH